MNRGAAGDAKTRRVSFFKPTGFVLYVDHTIGERHMRHFPLFLDLTDRRVLVVGTGPVAHRKSELLERARARVLLTQQFQPALLEGCALAIGADAAEPDLQTLADAAREAGIPVNIVDRPELCTFVMP